MVHDVMQVQLNMSHEFVVGPASLDSSNPLRAEVFAPEPSDSIVVIEAARYAMRYVAVIEPDWAELREWPVSHTPTSPNTQWTAGFAVPPKPGHIVPYG